MVTLSLWALPIMIAAVGSRSLAAAAHSCRRRLRSRAQGRLQLRELHIALQLEELLCTRSRSLSAAAMNTTGPRSADATESFSADTIASRPRPHGTERNIITRRAACSRHRQVPESRIAAAR